MSGNTHPPAFLGRSANSDLWSGIEIDVAAKFLSRFWLQHKQAALLHLWLQKQILRTLGKESIVL